MTMELILVETILTIAMTVFSGWFNGLLYGNFRKETVIDGAKVGFAILFTADILTIVLFAFVGLI